jgi:hypothetical protein
MRRERETSRGVDVLTDAGPFQFLRYLVRKGADELAVAERAADAPLWRDVDLPQDPVVLAQASDRSFNRAWACELARRCAHASAA